MRAAESKTPDLVVTTLVMLLTAVGLLMVYSTSGLMPGSYALRSVVYAVIGFTGFYFASRIDPERYRNYAYPALAVISFMLLLVWVPGLGVKAKGASRWIRFPGFQFQPSELAKLAVVIFLAHSLSKREPEKLQTFLYGFLPHVVIPGVPILLVLLEPDMGTAVVLGLLVFTMSFVGGVRIKHLALATVPAGVVAAALVWFVPYRRERFLAFLDPWQHAQTSGHQLCQSFLAFGAGGVWGVGLGAGKQKLHYLPEAHTDFILSIWAEEMGLVGVTVVLALFAVLVWRGYSIAVRQRDPYRRLLAMGITTWLALQASLNSLVVMGCLPTKGLPFPFLSYGGTGMVVTLTTAGILAGLGRKERAA